MFPLWEFFGKFKNLHGNIKGFAINFQISNTSNLARSIFVLCFSFVHRPSSERSGRPSPFRVFGDVLHLLSSFLLFLWPQYHQMSYGVFGDVLHLLSSFLLFLWPQYHQMSYGQAEYRKVRPLQNVPFLPNFCVRLKF